MKTSFLVCKNNEEFLLARTLSTRNQALVVEWREANSLVLRAAGSILPLRYAQVFG